MDGRRREEKSVADSWLGRRNGETGHEKIVESNIRRAFTVRFPNLYCVWQRCRDIRGSYRNVLLLIVPPPWRWCTIYEGWVGGGVCTQKREKEGRGRVGGEGLAWRPGKRGKERKGARKGGGPRGRGGEREKERKRRKRRRWKEERENDRGTQRALVLLTGR